MYSGILLSEVRTCWFKSLHCKPVTGGKDNCIIEILNSFWPFLYFHNVLLDAFFQIKFFMILAVFPSVKRVGGAHIRVIAPGQHSSIRGNGATVVSRWQHLACLHVHFWEPVLSSSAWILLSHTQKRFCVWLSKPFLCVTQQNSGPRTKNWFLKVHM